MADSLKSQANVHAVKKWYSVYGWASEAHRLVNAASERKGVRRMCLQLIFDLSPMFKTSQSQTTSSEPSIFYARAKTSKPMGKLAENVDTMSRRGLNTEAGICHVK